MSRGHGVGKEARSMASTAAMSASVMASTYTGNQLGDGARLMCGRDVEPGDGWGYAPAAGFGYPAHNTRPAAGRAHTRGMVHDAHSGRSGHVRRTYRLAVRCRGSAAGRAPHDRVRGRGLVQLGSHAPRERRWECLAGPAWRRSQTE